MNQQPPVQRQGKPAGPPPVRSSPMGGSGLLDNTGQADFLRQIAAQSKVPLGAQSQNRTGNNQNIDFWLSGLANQSNYFPNQGE
jgi:hypothetical protein